MEDKPKIDIGQYRSPKIKGRYVLKFGLYIFIFVALWFWYKKQEQARKDTKNLPSQIKKNPQEIDLDKLVLEP